MKTLTIKNDRRAHDAPSTSNTRTPPPLNGTQPDEEKRFQEIAEASTLGMAVLNADRILYMNPAGLQRFGAGSLRDITDRSMWDLLLPEDLEVARERLAFAAAGRLYGRVTLRCLRLDGGVMHLEAEGWPMRFHGDDCVHLTFDDVTDRRAAAAALRESEERFRLAFEGAPIGVLVTDINGRILRVNAAVARITGYDVQELLQRSFQDFTHPDDLPRNMELHAQMCASDHATYLMRKRYIRKDGGTVWVDAHATLLRNEDGQPLDVVAHVVDVTEARAAENALRASEEQFRLTFDRAPTGVALMSLDGTILRVNHAIVQMVDFTEQELVGRRFQDLTHPDDLTVNVGYLQEMLSGQRESYEIVKRYIRKNGESIWARVHCSVVRNADGEPLHLVGHVEDITEAHVAEEARRTSEERFRGVWENSAEGLRLTDLNGTIVAVNDAYCKIVGKSEAELVGRSVACVYRDEDGVRDYIESAIRQRAVQPFIDSHIEMWDGRDLWFEVTNAYIEHEGREPLLLSGFRDTTDRKRTLDALQRYRLLAENSNDIMVFVRPDGTILEANRAAERAYGYSRDELQSMAFEELVETAEAPEDGRAAGLPAATHEGALFPARHRRKGGRAFPVEMSVQAATIGEEGVLLMVIRDTTERISMERQLRHQASHDPLTKLPNRLLFMDRLEQALLRRDGRATVLFLDLDRFKNINDSLGHSAGDQLLVAVAGRLKSCIRASDTAARLGGDEFTVLLDGSDGTGEATRTAKRILRKLQAPFEVLGQEVFVSASIGVAVGQGAQTTAEELLREADLAMYQAKTSGKARHAVFVRERTEDARGRLQLETDLRRAIERGEFQVYYQPVVLMETRKTIAVEALTRWHHPRFGMMPPDEFVPLQEQIGMIQPFTMWVLGEAQRQCLALQRQGMRVSVAVNLSPYNLHEPDFAARVGEMLRESGLAPSSLKLEITENAIMTNPERALHILGELNDMGVRLSVDDFGTGYSSLTYLKQLPVHEIKIDKSFVLGMDANDEDDAAIVRATIDLAHNLRKKVVAEGVESADVWNLLNVLGCDAAQGFHMSPPLPALDLVPWLKASPFGLGQMKG